MSIDGISSAAGTTGQTETTGQTGVGMKGTKDEFLKLFMAQLQHQDPFAPTSGADMVAQLATLSQVEQGKATNDHLAELAAQQASAASAGLSSLVGRDCSAGASTFKLEKGGAVPPLELTSPSPTKGASVVITDAEGKELRRIPIADGSTKTSLAWDGRDASGNSLASGTYNIAIDGGSSPSAINATWKGRVDSVELTGDGPRLRMGGVLLAPGDIKSIGATSPLSPSSLVTNLGVTK